MGVWTEGGNTRTFVSMYALTYLPIEDIIKKASGIDRIESRDVVHNNTYTVNNIMLISAWVHFVY